MSVHKEARISYQSGEDGIQIPKSFKPNTSLLSQSSILCESNEKLYTQIHTSPKKVLIYDHKQPISNNTHKSIKMKPFFYVPHHKDYKIKEAQMTPTYKK